MTLSTSMPKSPPLLSNDTDGHAGVCVACREASKGDGSTPDAALVDSLSVGLASAVARLTHAHKALTTWLQGDMGDPVNLRAAPPAPGTDQA